MFGQRTIASNLHDCLAPAAVKDRQPKRQVVEQFVGDHNATNLLRIGERCYRLHAVGVHGALRGRQLDCDVAIDPLRCGVQDGTSQRAWPSTNLDYPEVGGLPEPVELGLDPASEHRTKQRPDLGRRDEVAATTCTTTTCTTNARVETLLAVQRYLDEFIEAQSFVQGSTPARSVIAPTLAIRPGSTPNTSVATPQMINAACTEPCTLIGVTSPSGAGFIHISRMTPM